MPYPHDVIVIGSGHNGLTTACYLAKAGYKVLVLERRDTLGGAVCTEEMFGGYKMDVGSSAHFMIHQTPVVQDLRLADYGLEYIDLDPFMSYPVADGKGGVIHFFKDLDRTLDSIATVAPEDVQNYRDFIAFWGRINKGVLRTFLRPPTGNNIIGEMLKGQFRDGSLFGKEPQVDGVRRILSSYGQEVESRFRNPHLKAALLWFAAQSGPTPEQTASADFVGWQAMLHESGAKRPRGGSGGLTQAMIRMLEAHGGEVRAEAPVRRIRIANGTATGVETEDGQVFEARAIVSNAHVQTTMLKLVGPEHLSGHLEKQVRDIHVGNGFGMVVRHAVDRLPTYTACPDDPHIHTGLQLLCPDRDYLYRAIGDYHKKLPPQEPAVIAMTWTKTDPTLAPPGKHVLFTWAQWHPYELAGGLRWDDIREREADKIYEVVVKYAPDMKGAIIDRYIQSPLDIERKHGMLRGNVMHVEMNFDQMFLFRPLPGLSRYTTPIGNLYLSSASCHPGGGVFAAAGYNAAGVVLAALKKKTWF